VKNEAEIVERRIPGEVDIGSGVTIEDIERRRAKVLRCGKLSSPRAKPFMGTTVGEEREVTIGERRTLFRVVDIE
jgi:transcription elongation GreA/GreB family factor